MLPIQGHIERRIGHQRDQRSGVQQMRDQRARMHSPRAWQVLDGLIGLTMFVLCAMLVRHAFNAL